MRKLILAGASLIIAGMLGLGGNAQAADMPVKAPVYVAPFTWTGIYLGINAGYGTGQSTGDSYCTTPAGVVLHTGEIGRPADIRDLRNSGIPGGQDQMLGPEATRLTVAGDLDEPFCFVVIVVSK